MSEKIREKYGQCSSFLTDWIDDFLSRSVNFACPEITSLQSICGSSLRPLEGAKEEDGSELGHL